VPSFARSEITRNTDHGIPRILAKSWKALGFGYGYALASQNICTIADSYVTVDAQRSRFFGPEKTWKVGYDGNLEVYDLYFTFLHEIGHTIGLDHPGASGEVMGFRYDERVRDLQDGDIEAVRRLYGERRQAERLSSALAR